MAADWIQDWYVQNDYPLNEVLITHTPTKGDPRVEFSAIERVLGGIRFQHKTAGGTTRDGPGKTQPELIFATLGLQIGHPFYMPSERFRRLDSLDLFDDVKMKPERVDNQKVFLFMELFEKVSRR